MSNVTLPDNWKTVSLGSLGRFFRGQGGTRSDESDNGLPCIRYGDIYTHHDCIVKNFCSAIEPDRASSYTPLQTGDVIFAGSGETFEEIGKAAAYCGQEKAYAGGDTLIFRPSSSLDPYFAGYAVNSDYANKNKARLGQGSSVIHISAEHLASIPLQLPPINQQQSIAATLQTIDRAIAHTEALIEKYQQIKSGLMHDLFTRGIGADGKLRSPREEAPELYQESAIGWIPKDWNCMPIKQYVKSAQYGISTSLSDEEVGIPVLRMNNIQENSFDVSDIKYTSNLDADNLKIKNGDVLYNRTNSIEHVGKTAIWRGELSECSFASYLVRINLHDDMILPHFFSYWMSQVSSQNALRRYATPGVQQVNINPTNLQKILISCPHDLEEQRRIVIRIDGIELKLQTEKTTLNKLHKAKAGLMNDLLTGKVPVNVDADEEDHG
ncbi:restriction endonuclease subunit S [Spirulina major]|uniref:restriction endonuclease subunit S n=1 Tax=Spirulina major TaxID=270636 RepID=UPI0009333CAA|nr:restriction endonuclease subunit S [Spirulina major]